MTPSVGTLSAPASANNMASEPFEFMVLPWEMRRNIYSCALSDHERVFLNPEKICFPLPWVRKSYGDTKNLLLVSKEVHAEVIAFLFTHKMINIIYPDPSRNFIRELGPVASQYIKSIEVVVHRGLQDLQAMWPIICSLPKLQSMRLVFYHDLYNWSKTFAELAELHKHDKKFLLYLEMYTSIWSPPKYGSWYRKNFNTCMVAAASSSNGMRSNMPQLLRKITITASVCRDAAVNIAKWRSSRADDVWRMKIIDYQKGDPMRIRPHNSPPIGDPRRHIVKFIRDDGREDEDSFCDDSEDGEPEEEDDQVKEDDDVDN